MISTVNGLEMTDTITFSHQYPTPFNRLMNGSMANTSFEICKSKDIPVTKKHMDMVLEEEVSPLLTHSLPK